MISMRAKVGDRVARHTSESVQQCIEQDTRQRVERLADDDAGIRRRLGQLDREWDIERTLETNASLIAGVGVALGLFVSRRFLLLPLAVMAFLLQHAIEGWCPPLPVFRRLGVRTAREIARERYALKAVRGDFDDLGDNPGQRSERVWSAIER